MLRAERLEVAYGGVIALQECSLEVGEGDCLAVLGANGAGKSTLLRTLARSVRQRSGHLWWDGTRIDRWAADRAARHGIALVPEGRRLFSGLSVRENLEVGAARLSGSEVEGRLAEVLRWFPELAQRLDLPAGRLSGGEQQMAGIARALMGRPRLLLVDELSLGLAPLVTRRIYEILARIATGGIAVVLVEQYTDLALAAAGSALVLEKGRVAFAGTADELHRRPELLETAYLGRELLARAPEAVRSGAAPVAGGRRRGAGDGRQWPAVAEVLLHLEAPEKRRVEEQARAAGVDVDEWIRRMIRESAAAPAPAPEPWER
ncbi:MAG TPA: ABC transporter ATP-binding protein [Candidatus Dormibacteraeota bacterium]|nr:ABC transporter ATP-binding protein [Candidatus Dormibacteraeota bacterium]